MKIWRKNCHRGQKPLSCAALRFLDCLIQGYGPPVIVFDIYNNHGKLQTVKLILPIGSHKQLKRSPRADRLRRLKTGEVKRYKQ